MPSNRPLTDEEWDQLEALEDWYNENAPDDPEYIEMGDVVFDAEGPPFLQRTWLRTHLICQQSERAGRIAHRLLGWRFASILLFDCFYWCWRLSRRGDG